jgi:hypothetical protein
MTLGLPLKYTTKTGELNMVFLAGREDGPAPEPKNPGLHKPARALITPEEILLAGGFVPLGDTPLEDFKANIAKNDPRLKRLLESIVEIKGEAGKLFAGRAHRAEEALNLDDFDVTE